MATPFKPPAIPDLDGRKSVFLAGTIDHGNSKDWQAGVEATLDDLDVVILNPRRDEWDASWEQRITHDKFREQVEWELDGLEAADWVFMYFAPGSQSPITLLELGLCARNDNVILVSPPGFWRRGNLEVVAARYGIPLHERLDEGLQALRRALS